MGGGGNPDTRLAIVRLEAQAGSFMANRIAQSTSKVYQVAQKCFLQFCHHLSLTPIPASEEVLILFCGGASPINDSWVNSIILVWYPAPSHYPWSRQPTGQYSPSQLLFRKIKIMLNGEPAKLWAACCLGFFGFLRSGEFLVTSAASFDPNRHLTAADIAIDDRGNPQGMAVHLKH